MPLFRLGLCLAVLLTALPAAGPAAEPTERQRLRAERLVKAYLATLDAPGAQLRLVTDSHLEKGFPDTLFVVATYGPGKLNLPRSLRASNILVVGKDNQVRHLASVKDRLELVRAAPAIRTPAQARELVRAVVALDVALHPEVRFTVAPRDVVVTGSRDAGFAATCKALPEGGEGYVLARVTTNSRGTVTEFFNEYTVRPGAVVVDPARGGRLKVARSAVVRVVEAYKGPVSEIKFFSVKPLAADLPGWVPFVVPASVETSRKEGALEVVVVDSSDKARHLHGMREIGVFVTEQFEPVTTEAQARKAMRVYLTLASGLYPRFRFDLKDMDVKVTSADGLKVIGRLPAREGPGGKTDKVLDASFTFGPRGKRRAAAYHFHAATER